MPLVSIIVPCYNHERYLPMRMDSILNQTFTDYEIILLDDKSTDRSAEILKSYSGDARVTHIIINQENSGNPFVQWERGLALAQGKYVWIAESDDSAEPTLLERCVEVLEKDEKLAICQVGCNSVDEDNKLLKNKFERWDGKCDGRVKKFGGSRFIRDYLVFYNFLYNASGIVFRRSAANPFPQKCKEMKSGGDWIFWIEMCQRGGVAIVREKLNVFRYCLCSASHKSRCVSLGEDIVIFKHNIDNHHFSKIIRHSYWCVLGHLQREVKHISYLPEYEELKEKLYRVSHCSTMMPYHYSQFTKMINYVWPWCIFPIKKRIWRY